MKTDNYIEFLDSKITALEKKSEAQEREFFAVLEIIKDIRMMNSLGKTKEIADEIDALLNHHNK